MKVCVLLRNLVVACAERGYESLSGWKWMEACTFTNVEILGYFHRSKFASKTSRFHIFSWTLLYFHGSKFQASVEVNCTSVEVVFISMELPGKSHRSKSKQGHNMVDLASTDTVYSRFYRTLVKRTKTMTGIMIAFSNNDMMLRCFRQI